MSTSKKFFKLRLGSLHGHETLQRYQVDLQRVSLNLIIGGDLVDLISIEDKKYTINFGLPTEIDNDLKARLVIQTSNKVKQVIYGSIEGSLNSLLAMSNNQVAKLWIQLDPEMMSGKATVAPVRISDAKNCQSPVRVALLLYTGSKESTELDDIKRYLSPRADAGGDEEDNDESMNGDAQKQKAATECPEIRYLMPNHMPQYLRIDMDIKEGLLRLSDLMKEYSNFDVLALERDTTRTLELELDKQSADYKRHNRTTEKRLTSAAEKLEKCIILKDQIIQTRMNEIRQSKETYSACLNFQRKELVDSAELQRQRELIMQVDTELRRAYNINALAQMDASRLSTLEQEERNLVQERHSLVLKMLQLALLDINHHLQLIETRKTISIRDVKALHEFAERLTHESKEAQKRYLELEQRIQQNSEEYQKKTQIFQDELRIILEENNQLAEQRHKQDNAMLELQMSLQQMMETEQKISSEWLAGVQMMEEKVLGMKESMTITLTQLRENTRQLEQYKVRMQAMKIRFAIESKVRQSYEAAQFKERYRVVQAQIQESTSKQEALQAHVSQIKGDWSTYFSKAIMEVKDRFEQIESSTFLKYMEEQKIESDKIDLELDEITGAVQQLEMDVQSTTSTQVSGEDENDQEEIVQLKFQAEQKLILFRNLLNKKSVLYAELLTNARILMDMNDQLIANEEDKLRLMEQIDVSTLEILQKRQAAVDLQKDMNSLKETYAGLKQDIKNLDHQAEFLKGRVRECEDEFDQMKELVSHKKLEVEHLEKQTGVKAPQVHLEFESKVSSSAYYRAIKGDLVDELVGQNLTEMQCTLPVRRLCDGFYLFGTKKIFVKVNKGVVIVRQQGGGYQNFADYVELNTSEEQLKIDDLKRTGEWDQDALVEYYLQEINATPSTTGMATYTNRQAGISPMAGGGRRSPGPGRAAQGSPGRGQASPGKRGAKGFGSTVARGL